MMNINIILIKLFNLIYLDVYNLRFIYLIAIINTKYI